MRDPAVSSSKCRLGPGVRGALCTQACSAGAENEYHPPCVPSPVGINLLAIALECSVMTLMQTTGPRHWQPFLFVLYLCFSQASAGGVATAASTKAFCRMKRQEYRKARPHVTEACLPRTFSQGPNVGKTAPVLQESTNPFGIHGEWGSRPQNPKLHTL